MDEDDVNTLRADQAAPPARPLRYVGPGQSGAVIHEGIAAVEGVQPYPEQGNGYAEYVSRAAIEATAAGLVGVQLFAGERAAGRVLHPGQAEGALVQATPETWQDHTVGAVLRAEVIEIDANDAREWGLPPSLIASIWRSDPSPIAACKVAVSVFDADAQQGINDGSMRALSPLYQLLRTHIDPTPGEWRGQRYNAVQTGRNVNNLCLVDDGRGGALCVLRADATPTGDAMPDPAAGSLDALMEFLKGYASSKEAKMIVRAWLGESAEPEEPVMDADPAMKPEEMAAIKADAAAQKQRADAAEKALAALRAEKEAEILRADAARADAGLKNLGITIEGWDATKADRAAVQRADAAILAHAAKPTTRADSRIIDPTNPSAGQVQTNPLRPIF